MDTKNIIMIVLFFLLGISFLVFIVRAFIKWESRRERNMSFLMAFFLFILLAGNGIYLLVTFVKYAKDKGEEAVTTVSTELLSENYSESPQLKRIREMQPKDKSIPEPYFTYGGFRDHWRMPLVYPYSMNAIDDLDIGYINDESGIANIAMDVNNGKQILYGIDLFTFDENMLLGELYSIEYEIELEYIILDFKTGNIERFATEKEMQARAKEKGYDTTKKMIGIKSYYNMF